VLHPGLPEAESASLGNKQRKALGVFPSLGGGAGQDAAQNRGKSAAHSSHPDLGNLIFFISFVHCCVSGSVISCLLDPNYFRFQKKLNIS
jgi:hypothetical protein